MRISDLGVRNSGCEKIVGVKIVSGLNLNEYLDWILKEVGHKVNA